MSQDSNLGEVGEGEVPAGVAPNDPCLPRPADEAGQLCSEELALLERCLLVNPKSYCVWFHRAWILGHAPAPDWLHEKSLCNRFLKYDERNCELASPPPPPPPPPTPPPCAVHCWDYRRLVVSKAQVAPDDELSFSQDKIHSNFSNYSAWHYRSKLLPLLGPAHPHQEGGVAPDTLSKGLLAAPLMVYQWHTG